MVGLLTNEKKVTFRALRPVQNQATYYEKKKVAKEDTDCSPYQGC